MLGFSCHGRVLPVQCIYCSSFSSIFHLDLRNCSLVWVFGFKSEGRGPQKSENYPFTGDTDAGLGATHADSLGKHSAERDRHGSALGVACENRRWSSCGPPRLNIPREVIWRRKASERKQMPSSMNNNFQLTQRTFKPFIWGVKRRQSSYWYPTLLEEQFELFSLPESDIGGGLEPSLQEKVEDSIIVLEIALSAASENLATLSGKVDASASVYPTPPPPPAPLSPSIFLQRDLTSRT